jgi:hypothetical protein
VSINRRIDKLESDLAAEGDVDRARRAALACAESSEASFAAKRHLLGEPRRIPDAGRRARDEPAVGHHAARAYSR